MPAKLSGQLLVFTTSPRKNDSSGNCSRPGRWNCWENIVLARMVVEFPEDVWLTEASRRFPLVTFEIQSILPASLLTDSPDLIVNNALVKIVSIEWEKILEIIEPHPSILALHKWDVKDDEVLINVKSKDSFILRSLIESECILKYPVTVQDGKGTWELISPRNRIDALLELFDHMGIIYSIASIGALKKEEGQLTLTKRQELYWKNPRAWVLRIAPPDHLDRTCGGIRHRKIDTIRHPAPDLEKTRCYMNLLYTG